MDKKETENEAVYRLFEKFFGDKVPGQLLSSIRILIVHKDDRTCLEVVRQQMHYNCDFETAAEIATTVAIIDPDNICKWFNLLVENLNLDNELGVIDDTNRNKCLGYRFGFGIILAVFKIANELSAHNGKNEIVKKFLVALPDTISKIIKNKCILINFVDDILAESRNETNSHPEHLKVANQFRSKIATEITKYVRCDNGYDDRQRLVEVLKILESLKMPNGEWDSIKKYGLGALIIDQICYALFGTMSPKGKATALQLYFSGLSFEDTR